MLPVTAGGVIDGTVDTLEVTLGIGLNSVSLDVDKLGDIVLDTNGLLALGGLGSAPK